MHAAQNSAWKTFYGGSLVFHIHLDGFSPEDMTHGQFVAMAAKLQCQVSQAVKACMPSAHVELAMGRDQQRERMDFAERVLLGAVQEEVARIQGQINPSESSDQACDPAQVGEVPSLPHPEDQVRPRIDHGKREESSSSTDRYSEVHRAGSSSATTEKSRP